MQTITIIIIAVNSAYEQNWPFFFFIRENSSHVWSEVDTPLVGFALRLWLFFYPPGSSILARQSWKEGEGWSLSCTGVVECVDIEMHMIIIMESWMDIFGCCLQISKNMFDSMTQQLFLYILKLDRHINLWIVLVWQTVEAIQTVFPCRYKWTIFFVPQSDAEAGHSKVMSELEQGLLAINTFAQGFAVTYMLRLLHRFKRIRMDAGWRGPQIAVGKRMCRIWYNLDMKPLHYRLVCIVDENHIKHAKHLSMCLCNYVSCREQHPVQISEPIYHLHAVITRESFWYIISSQSQQVLAGFWQSSRLSSAAPFWRMLLIAVSESQAF